MMLLPRLRFMFAAVALSAGLPAIAATLFVFPSIERGVRAPY